MQELSKILETSLGGYSLSRILSAVLTLLVCLIVSRLLLKLAKRLLDRSKKLTARLRQIVLTSAKVVLYLLTGIITAEALGLNTSSLTALVSVLTLGVTLAAEDILGNVAGGLVILTSHPFNIGDDIEVADTVGTVREITLNHTKIETPDGQFVMQPNKELSSSRIINYTAMGRRRVVRTVTASYDAPTATVKQAIGEVLEELNMLEKTITVHGVGCCGLAMEYVTYDCTTSPHGRACAVATGVKRAEPDKLVFTYQGDGDLASIGLAETMSAANRGENITVIFVNNGIYGMTGGQMAPTTLIGQKATTCPAGRSEEWSWLPIKLCETLAAVP